MWFDANELPRILAWVRRGGLASAAARHAEEAKADQRKRELDQSIEARQLERQTGSGLYATGEFEGLLEFLGRLFR